MNGQAEQTKARVAKVVIIGDAATGKTSLRNSWLHGPSAFTQQYKTTIGADFYTKKVETDEGPLSMAVWDTAGAERFKSLGAAFYRGADAVVIVFSVIDQESLRNVATWYSEFKARAPVEDGREGEMTWVCVANKLDLAQGRQSLSQEEAQDLLNSLLPPSDDGDVTPRVQENGLPEEVSAPPNYSTQDALKQNDQHPLHKVNLPSSSSPESLESPLTKRGRITSIRSIDITPSSLRHSSSTTTGNSIYHTPAGSISYSQENDSTIKLPGGLDGLPQSAELEDLELDVETRPCSPIPPPIGVLDDQINKSRKPYDGIKLFFTSARNGQGVADPFEYAARHIMERFSHQQSQQTEMNGFSLDNVRGGGSTAVKVGDPPGAIRKGWRGCC